MAVKSVLPMCVFCLYTLLQAIDNHHVPRGRVVQKPVSLTLGPVHTYPDSFVSANILLRI